MNILNLLAASATLLLMAGPAAGQAFLPYASGPPLQLAAEGSFGAKKDEYLQKAKAELQEWKQKIQDAGEKTDAKAQDATAASKSLLQRAWAKTEDESRKLETASADGWESAKVSFEKASKNLKDSWQKAHPDTK